MTRFEISQFPHCDASVLHAPGECEYCDQHSEWQALREGWGIAFTGHDPVLDQQPCPSDARRGTGEAHVWGGNRPTNVRTQQEQTAASFLLYGEDVYSSPRPIPKRPWWRPRSWRSGR